MAAFRFEPAIVTIGLAITAGCTAIAWAATLGNSSIVDEAGHHSQIALFQAGDLKLYRLPGEEYPWNAMLPGFHAAVAAIATAIGADSRAAIRAICLCWSVLLGFFVWGIVRHDGDNHHAALRTIQACFLPNLFPFHFLIYTDVLAAALCMAALYFCLKDRPVAAGTAACAAALVRQTNGLFALFLIAFTAARGNNVFQGGLRVWAKRWWPLVAGLVPLVAVLASYGRVGLDDPMKHPLRIASNNLKWSVLECGIFFLPWHAWVYGGQWRRIRPWMVVGAIALAGAVVWWAQELHPWNDPIRYSYLLRNHWVAWAETSMFRKSWICLGVAVVLVALAVAPLLKGAAQWLYPLWGLLLLPHWNVDPRYHILPLLLFTVLRQPGPIWMETATAVGMIGMGFFAFGSIWWFHGIV